MSTKKTACARLRGVITFMAIFVPAVAMAASFVPYPGKRMVRLMAVKEPDLVVVNFDTDMIGFFRTIQIRLAGIEVPKDLENVPVCERALARKALAFSRNYLAAAKNVYVQDMRMQTSADDIAVSPILTNRGNLADELVKHGLARSDEVDPNRPWCG